MSTRLINFNIFLYLVIIVMWFLKLLMIIQMKIKFIELFISFFNLIFWNHAFFIWIIQSCFLSCTWFRIWWNLSWNSKLWTKRRFILILIRIEISNPGTWEFIHFHRDVLFHTCESVTFSLIHLNVLLCNIFACNFRHASHFHFFYFLILSIFNQFIKCVFNRSFSWICAGFSWGLVQLKLTYFVLNIILIILIFYIIKVWSINRFTFFEIILILILILVFLFISLINFFIRLWHLFHSCFIFQTSFYYCFLSRLWYFKIILISLRF